MSLLLDIRCFQMALLEVFPMCSPCPNLSAELLLGGTSHWRRSMNRLGNVRKCSISLCLDKRIHESCRACQMSQHLISEHRKIREWQMIYTAIQKYCIPTLIEMKMSGLEDPSAFDLLWGRGLFNSRPKILAVLSMFDSYCHASVCSSVFCLVTTEIWSDGH